MIELGQHKELAEALEKRRKLEHKSRSRAAEAMGVGLTTYNKLVDNLGKNTSAVTQYKARLWVNRK